MWARNIFSSSPAAVAAEEWSHDGLGTKSGQDSLKRHLLSRQPGSPSSPVSGELIATAVPSDVAAAADSPVSQASAAAAAAYGLHSGLEGAHPSLDAGELSEASFEELCNDGSAWTWANWTIKLYRWTVLWIKQLYLFFLAFSVPTNHLMVSEAGREGAGWMGTMQVCMSAWVGGHAVGGLAGGGLRRWWDGRGSEADWGAVVVLRCPL